MKLMTGLTFLALTMNMALAAQTPNEKAFAKAKKNLTQGVFEGKTNYYKKDCQVTVVFQKDSKGSDVLVGKIDFIDHKGKPQSSSIVINSKTDEVEFEMDGDTEYKTVSLSKSKTVPEEDTEYELTEIESVKQYFEDDKLIGLRLEWMVINEHSDPSDSSLECNLK